MIPVVLFAISFLLCLYTYLLYPMLLKLFTSKIKKKDNIVTDNQTLPKISFVIPVYNEAEILAEKIKNTLELEYPQNKMEIIVASDGSSDGSNEIAKSFPQVRFFGLSMRKGKIHLLNRIIDEVTHEIVIFSDASAMLEKNAVIKIVRHFSNPEVGCVSGKYVFILKKNSPRSEGEGIYWHYETRLKELENRFIGLLGAHGAFYAIRKSAYEKVRDDVINDDYVIPMLVWKKGYRCVYEPLALAHEIHDADFKGEVKRRIRIGMGNIQQIFLLKDFLLPRWGKITFCFISHKVLRTLLPFFLITMLTSSIFFAPLLFYAQLVLYLSACFSIFRFRKFQFLKRISTIVLYFTISNASMLVGVLKYPFLRRDKILWEKP